MKRSQAVTLTLLAAAAAALTGCTKTETKRCVDDKQQIVDDSLCAQVAPAATGNTTGNTTGSRGYGGGYGGYRGGYYYPYHWWYGGASGGRLGDRVIGGAAVPTPGVRGVTGSTSRGGFGTSMGTSGS